MTSPAPVDRDLVEMMSAVFAAHREQHEPGTEISSWDTDLWARLAELGLVRLTGSEAHGGSGAGWFEAAELIGAAARHGVRVPLAEHDLLAGWLLETAGLPGDDLRRTVAILDAIGIARAVPWAAQSERITLVWHDGTTHRIADVATDTLDITPGANRAGEPRDTVTAPLSVLSGTAVPETVIAQLRLRGALVRAVQMCAALDRILEMSIAHTTARVQFGRPLAKFQAIAHLVADIAGEASLARATTEAAITEAVRTDWAGKNLEFLVAVARSCAGHAASVVVRNAHQVHGAIGTTREHRLHEFTQPALAWRSEFGSVRYWDDYLTAAALTAGSDGLWALITA
ncbi:MAG: acyl-CoA dehydrogenase family protein [Rhodococcus sp. (in: high G+C Gram-positive bacteria)]|uniref:acyl-CoA dehydrogenase family protein n=1 Tax=Rhodococcus sp. TaxID=1831 RepID=UPI003BB7E642